MYKQKKKAENFTSKKYDFSPTSSCTRLFANDKSYQLEDTMDIQDHNTHHQDHNTYQIDTKEMLLKVSSIHPDDVPKHLNNKVVGTFVNQMRKSIYSNRQRYKKFDTPNKEKPQTNKKEILDSLYIDRIKQKPKGKNLKESFVEWQGEGQINSSNSSLEGLAHYNYNLNQALE